MKIKYILILLLFCSCTKNTFSGHVYDYDTEQPIKNVQININGNKTQTDSTGYFSVGVNSNSGCTILLNKKGYTTKKVYRKPDFNEELSKRNLKNKIIYLYNEENNL